MLRRPWIPAVLLIALALASYGHGMLPGRTMIPLDVLWAMVPPWNHRPPVPDLRVHNPVISDQVLQFEPWAEFMRQELAAGRLPLWNPYVAGGVPFAANPQTACFYPLSTPLVAGLPDQGPALRAALHVLLACGFMMLFLRRLGCTPLGAGFGAIAYAYSQFMVGWIGYPIGWALAWFPGWLYVADRLAVEARPGRTFWLAAGVIGMSALAGHPESTVHCALASLGYALFRSAGARGVRESWRGPVRLGLAGVVGAGLAAVMLVPFFEYLGQSTAFHSRQAGDHEMFARPAELLLGAFFPRIFGAPSDGYVAVNFNERAVYAGLITLLLAAGELCRRSTWRAPWSILIALGAIGLAAGFDLFGFHRALSFVPGLAVAANHRLVFLAVFAAAALAARALTRLARGARLAPWIWSAGGLYVLSVLLLVLPAATLLPHVAEVPRATVERAVLIGVVLLVAAAGLTIALRRQPARLALGLAILGAVDCAAFAWNVNTVTPAAWRNRTTPEIEAIRARRPDRLATLDNAFLPASALPYRLRTLASYEALGIHRFDRLAAPVLPVRPETLGDARLRLLAVSHLYAPLPLPDPPPGWTHEPCGLGHLYRVADALPRAYLAGSLEMYWDWEALAAHLDTEAFDPSRRTVLADLRTNYRYPGRPIGPSEHAEIVVDLPGRVEVAVNPRGPAMLVLADAFYPGWTVTVDGRPGYAMRVFGGLRGVPLRGGERRVVFRYSPRSVLVGACLTGCASVLLLLGLGVSYRRRKTG